MQIKTKFEIGDLVRHKFQRSSSSRNNAPIAAVVQYITTETCSAGTQVFYSLRFLHQLTMHEWTSKENEIVDIVPSTDATNKFREDELMELPEEVRKIITNEI